MGDLQTCAFKPLKYHILLPLAFHFSITATDMLPVVLPALVNSLRKSTVNHQAGTKCLANLFPKLVFKIFLGA